MESPITAVKTEVEEAEEEEFSTNWINTDYSCFLCLQNSTVVKVISLRSLLRHLQINEQEIYKRNDGNAWQARNGEWDDIEVDLCISCAGTHSRLHTLLEQLEKIQIEVNYLLEETNKSISESGRNSKLGETLFAKLSINPRAPFNFDFVDNLRKRIAEKCKVMQIGRQPKIILESVESGNHEAVIHIGTKSSGDEDSSSYQMEMLNRTAISVSEEEPSAHSGLLSAASSEPRRSLQLSNQKILLEKGNPSVMSFGKKSKDAVPSTSKCRETRTCEGKTLKLASLRRKKRASKYFTNNGITGLFQCRKCEKKSPCQTTIRLHYKSSHLKIRHRCDICNVSVFARRHALAKHRLTCRRNLERREAKEKDPKFRFVCEMCGKRFGSQKSLTDHRQKVHKNVDRFPCDLCDKKFKTKSQLNQHKDGVHSGKKMACRFCKKLFGFKSNVFAHEKSCLQKETLKAGDLAKHA